MKYQFEAIGTQWELDFELPSSKDHPQLLQQILERIEFFDATYSRFRPDSLVTAMSQTADTWQLPADAQPLLQLYQHLYDLTHGAFTPLIGQFLSDAGYDAEYSLQPKKTKPILNWHEVMSYQHPSLSMYSPQLLDFGAAGKGYLIDLVAEELKKWGATSFTIDAGGDIKHYSQAHAQPLTIGLENPLQLDEVIGVVEFSNQSICASAGNRRSWDTYHHIINPHTQSSPRHILATWVIAPTALIADALATALFLVEPEELLPHFQFDYLILQSSMQIKKSSGFTAQLFFE